ncbi:hypothetical protein MKEN_00115000 [Mycena kentingensis (nom. inval.)]|nr:hypothetical protein MKEN_00115000 [Mycena kentingensis (nom. inval.)]
MDPIDLVSSWTRSDIFDWGNISHLAFQVVYNALDRSGLNSTRDRRPRAPLEEILASRLPDDEPLQTLRLIQQSAWRSVPYILRRRVHGITDAPTGLGDIDDWVRVFETRLSLVEDSPHSDYLGLVNLDNVKIIFPELDPATGMRVLPRTSNAINISGGYRVFDEGRKDILLIQPSNSMYSVAFDRVTGGLLEGLDWTSIFVAGGIALQALLDVEGVASTFGSDSDIDLFLYDIDPQHTEAKVRHVYQTVRRNLPVGHPLFVVRNSRTITLYSHFPVRRVQLVLRVATLLRDVPMNFDLDVCAVAWDGSVLWITPRAMRALETGYNCFRVDMLGGKFRLKRYGSSMNRIVKYANRGFGVNFLPVDIGSPTNLTTMEIVSQKARDYRWGFHELYGGPPLVSFLTFMKHETLWTLVRRGDVKLKAATDAEEEDMSSYVQPRLGWGPDVPFGQLAADATALNEKRNKTSHEGIMHLLDAFYPAKREDSRHQVVSDAVFGTRSVLFGDTVESVVGYGCDLTRVVMLPISLATFFNDSITKVQVLKKLRIGTTFVPVHSDEQWGSMSSPRRLRPYVWSIPSEQMWENLDPVLDAVYRVAGVFYAMTQRSASGGSDLGPRWVLTHLVKPTASVPAYLRDDYFRGWIRRADEDRNDLHYTPAELSSFE